MQEGSKYLDTLKNLAREKLTELDIKIPEFFILATSIIIIFLSTEGKSILPILIFIFILLLAIISIFLVRRIHQLLFDKISKTEGEIEKINLDVASRNISQEEGIKRLDNVIKTYQPKDIAEIRRWIDRLFYIKLILFFIGVILIFVTTP